MKSLLFRVMLGWIIIFLPHMASAQDGFGQSIQIITQLHSFIGKPSWMIMVRDVDHNQNIPYVFDLRQGNNFWIVLTYGTHYLISASTLEMETYQSTYNAYKKYTIHDFCNLESNGRINKGESMYLVLSGNLSPNTNTYSCKITKFKTS